MRVHPVDALGVGDADGLDHLDRAGLDLVGTPVLAVVEGDDLLDLLAHLEDGVERRHGLLVDHRDLGAADLLHGLLGGLGHVDGMVAEVKANRAAGDLALRALQELDEREARDRLAAAGLADHAHRLAHGNLVGDAIDRLDDAGVREEAGVQIVELDGVGRVLHLARVLGGVDVLALAQLLVALGDLAVLLGDTTGLLRGKVARLLLLIRSKHWLPLPSGSSSGRRRHAGRRPRS